jgi:hypothetical protein
VLLAGPAYAQDADSKRAATLFTEGREALARGDTEVACDKFRESFRLGKRASAMLNLAQCEETRGKLADALSHWKEGSSMLEPSDERVAVAGEHLRAIEPRVPRLRLRMAPRIPPSAQVTLDGTPVSTSSLETTMPVNPGAHEIVLAIPGRPEQRHTIVVKEREQQEVVLGTDSVPITPPASEPQPQSQARRIATWTAGGVGAAGVLTAAVTGVMILSKKSTVEGNCPNKVCNATGRDAIDSANPLITVNYIGWGVGIVGAGVATWLLLTNPSQQSGSTTAIAPTWIPGGMGLTFDRRF